MVQVPAFLFEMTWLYCVSDGTDAHFKPNECNSSQLEGSISEMDFHAPWTQRILLVACSKLPKPQNPFQKLLGAFFKGQFLVVLSLSASSFPGRPSKSLKSLRCFKMCYCSGALNDREMTGLVCVPGTSGNGLSAPQQKPLFKKNCLFRPGHWARCSLPFAAFSRGSGSLVSLSADTKAWIGNTCFQCSQIHRVDTKMHHGNGFYILKSVATMVFRLLG